MLHRYTPSTAHLDELETQKRNLSEGTEKGTIPREDFVKFFKHNEKIEEILVDMEIKMYSGLTQLLKKKGELRQSRLEHLKEVGVIEIDP